MRIVLYTREGCHLCEQAEDLLACHGIEAVHADVDASQETAACYGFRVPVLEVDGRPVLEGRIEEAALLNALREP